MIPAIHSILNSPQIETTLDEVITKLMPAVGHVKMPVRQDGIVDPEWLANSTGQLRVSSLVMKLQLTVIAGLVDYLIQIPNIGQEGYYGDAVTYAKGLIVDVGKDYEEAFKQAEQKSKIIVPGNNKILK